MVKNKACVYWCNIKNIQYTDEDIQICNRITGLNNPKYLRNIDLNRHITGLLLAEWAANQFQNVPKLNSCLSTRKICYGKNLKPYFEDECFIMFNISHSGDIVTCAVSDCEVGIDIEFITKSILQLMEKICDKKELEWLNQQKKIEDQYSLWTYKESFLKCTGEGIKKIRNTISMIEYGKLIEQYNNYSFKKLYISEGYVAAICTVKPMEAYYIEEVDHTCLKQLLKIRQT